MLPLALIYGMSPREFWEEEPRLFETYRIFYEENQKINDSNLWLQGYYTYLAVQVNLYNILRKKGAPPQDYLSEPLMQIQEHQQQTQEEQIKIRESNIRNRLERMKKILAERKETKG